MEQGDINSGVSCEILGKEVAENLKNAHEANDPGLIDHLLLQRWQWICVRKEYELDSSRVIDLGSPRSWVETLLPEGNVLEN